MGGINPDGVRYAFKYLRNVDGLLEIYTERQFTLETNTGLTSLHIFMMSARMSRRELEDRPVPLPVHLTFGYAVPHLMLATLASADLQELTLSLLPTHTREFLCEDVRALSRALSSRPLFRGLERLVFKSVFDRKKFSAAMLSEICREFEPLMGKIYTSFKGVPGFFSCAGLAIDNVSG